MNTTTDESEALEQFLANLPKLNKKKQGRPPKITLRDYPRLISLYNGELKVKEIAEKFDVTEQAIFLHLKVIQQIQESDTYRPKENSVLLERREC